MHRQSWRQSASQEKAAGAEEAKEELLISVTPENVAIKGECGDSGATTATQSPPQSSVLYGPCSDEPLVVKFLESKGLVGEFEKFQVDGWVKTDPGGLTGRCPVVRVTNCLCSGF